MKPLLIIDEPSVEALERKAHAGLASAVLGPGGPWLRHVIRIPGRHLRFEVFAPPSAEPRIRAFLQKQVALGAAASTTRAEYKFQPAEGQHVLKVFDRRGAAAAAGGPGLLGRFVGLLAGHGGGRAMQGDGLRQTVQAEMTRVVDRLTGPASAEIGRHLRIELLHDAERWLPLALDLAGPLSRRAAERIQIFHGRSAEVRVSVVRPDGTQPLGVDGERLRAAWADAARATSDRPEQPSAAQGQATTPLVARMPDPEGTLMIEAGVGGLADRPLRLLITGPKGTATVQLPLQGRVVLSRAHLGAAIAAVGADARLLPRADERCPVLDLQPGSARLAACGEHPRFATVGGQALKLGIVTVPATMRLGPGTVGGSGVPPATIRLEHA
jgi:hypothetical protein